MSDTLSRLGVMGTRHAAAARRGRESTRRTRSRIVAAVRAMLAEGTFHEATVEAVAERAGVARATVYQHFGSRVGLVDAMCETFDENPALIGIRAAVRAGGPDVLDEAVAGSIRFWASEEAVLAPLYGAAAIDPAARDLVDRQRADRRGEFETLLRHLRTAGRLRPGVSHREALATVLMLTSFETFVELRRLAGLSERAVIELVRSRARATLLPGGGRAG
jgi:AcrR family transcriptional regulator